MDVPATKVVKKRTVALSEAQKRYYEKHRDSRLAQMRERAKERNAEEREACIDNPELLEERRKKFLDKYYAYQMSNTTKQIDGWKADPGVCPTFKSFLKENVEPVKTLLPRKFFSTLSKLAIAVKPVPEVPTNTIVYGGAEDSISTADHYANSQTERYF